MCLIKECICWCKESWHLILFQICRCELFYQIIKPTYSFSVKNIHSFCCNITMPTTTILRLNLITSSPSCSKVDGLASRNLREIEGDFHGSVWNFSFKQGSWLTQRCVTFSCRNQSVHISFTVDDVRWLYSPSVFQHLLHIKNSARKHNATCPSTARPLTANDSLAPRCIELLCCPPEILISK